MTQNNALTKRIIAVTGGIGSGKSAVCRYLAARGEVVSCDEINNEMLFDKDYLGKLKDLFPETFLNGYFDKKALAMIIFSDATRREQLNALAHPEIMKRMQNKIFSAKTDVVFTEVPLLAGTAFEKMFREIIVVKADFDIRIKRIMARDNVSKEEAIKKIDTQNSDPTFAGARVYTIDNSGTQEELQEACDRLIKQIFTE